MAPGYCAADDVTALQLAGARLTAGDPARVAGNASVPILVVDDNAAKRLALKAVLAPLGHSIVEADSGLAALRSVMAQDFAVILLDVRMPVMDGFETAALIRQRAQSEMTPIIFITALGADEITTTERYVEGAVDFIFAPVVPHELRAKVTVFANLFRKAEELARRAQDVQSSADQLRLLTDAAPIGIFHTDADNRYVYTNPRWTEITGIDSAEAVGRDWETIIASEHVAGSIRELPDRPVYRNETCLRFEIRRPGKDVRMVLVTSKSIPDGHGGVAGSVGTLADVTAEVEAEEIMADARDKATEASRLKSDFLANVSHEIRTPMNGVIGMTDLLIETDLDSRQRDYAQTVRNSGEALLTIINDVLDFSKIEAGQLTIEDIPFDLRTCVDDVVHLLVRAAQTKEVELISVVEGSVPTVVGGDPGRVRQVLTNLIGNAIKFTGSGEVVIRASVIDDWGPDALIRFEVSDTGDGIAPDKVGAVFLPFVQADSSTSRKYGGTGLGLAISSHLIGLMGGDCGVSSVLGEGSTFWFTIRVHVDADRVAYTAPPPDPDLADVVTLVVDDNDTQREVVAGFLSDLGTIVHAAASGEDALTAMHAAATAGVPIAIAVIDRSMPSMSGLELRDAIVAHPTLSPRLVLMTDLGHEYVHSEAAGSGISAALSKPIDPERLRGCLRIALGLQVADPPGDRAPAPKSPSSAAPRGGRLLVAEDNLVNQKVAVAMLSGAGYRVDTVLNGAAAVEAAAKHPYTAVLMDCQMPELNGYEATAAIRAQEGADRHTPIIAMTAGIRAEDRDRCMSAGMDGYLAKPVSRDTLLALVARLGRTSDGAGPEADDGDPDKIAFDHNLFDELGVAVEGDAHAFLTDLVDQFSLDTEALLETLREALVTGDAKAVGRIAHSIMGSASQMGGTRLASSSDRLERLAIAGQLAEGAADMLEIETHCRELHLALTEHLSSSVPGGRRALHV